MPDAGRKRPLIPYIGIGVDFSQIDRFREISGSKPVFLVSFSGVLGIHPNFILQRPYEGAVSSFSIKSLRFMVFS